MTCSRRLAARFVPAVLVLSFIVVAEQPAAAAARNYICNNWTRGIGVIHLQDGSYGRGNYDAVLPATRCTDDYFGWNEAAGWYTAHPYCTSQTRSDNGGTSYWQKPDLGPGQHFIGATTSYRIQNVWKCIVET